MRRSPRVGEIRSDDRVERFRQPEIEYLHLAVTGKSDVRGLQVAMDHALLVRGFEGISDLPSDI